MEPSDAMDARERRRQWMRTMALAPLEALEAAYQSLSLQPTYQFLRRPESGAIMLQGRVSGEGAAFNMGEATLTRCTVLIQDGAAGTGYVLGCNPRKAELMALCDALLQDNRFHGRAQVPVRRIDKPLIARICMDCRHQAPGKTTSKAPG